MANTSNETEILKLRDPLLIDSNDWPDFQLTDVEVFDPRTELLSSLILADESRPLCVTGRLAKSKDRISYLLNRRLHDTLPIRILVQNVQTFSYGQADTGDIILWAGGQAGWFELSPGRIYKAIFQNDCEAISCLYFLADLYRELRGHHRRKIHVEEVFQQYAEEPSHKCGHTDRAEEVFMRHRNFLVDCMEKGKEGQSWRSTSIYSFLRDAVDDDEDAIMADGDELPPPLTPNPGHNGPQSTHAGKGKSTLRPKSKSKGLGQRGTDEEVEDESSAGTPTYAVTPSIPTKRKGPALTNGRTRRSRYLESQEEDVDTTMGGAEETADVPLPFKTTTSSERPKPSAKSPPVRLRHTPMPTFDALFPGDVWSCPFDGCSTRVYAASQQASRKIIKEHYQQHAFDAQAQIDAVCAEERPYLPVGKLVEKIRQVAAQRVGQAKGGDDPVGGVEGLFPKPIEQKF